MRSVTLRDVATKVGVSIATVSAVVNGADWVSGDTRVRVERAVEQMGYRPNQFARGLKTQQGYAVGVIVSDLTNPFFTEIVRSLSHELREHGRAHFLCDSDHRFDLGEANLRMLLDAHVIGLVIIGDSVREEAVQRYMRRRVRVPIVAIERDYGIDDINCLLVDSERGAYELMQHLFGQGYTKIAMIGGPDRGAGSSTYGRTHRYDGYVSALKDAGITSRANWIAEGNFRYAGGQEAMRRLLASGVRFDAVFAANDMMALGAMSVIRDAGLRVPDDIALVGWDDIPTAGLTSPGLTTMAMPKTELGATAASVILRQIGGNLHTKPVRRMFDPQLIVRQSSMRGGGGGNGRRGGHRS